MQRRTFGRICRFFYWAYVAAFVLLFIVTVSAAIGLVWPYFRPLSGTPIRTLTYQGETYEILAFSPDDKLLAGQSDRGVTIWDLRDGSVVGRHEGGSGTWNRPRNLAFTPDGKHVYAECSGRLVRWDVAGKSWSEPTWMNFDRVKSWAFSRDGRKLAICAVPKDRPGNQAELTIWDVAAEPPKLEVLRSTCDANQLLFAPDGATLAIANSRLELFRLASIECKLLTNYLGDPKAIQFSSDGTWLHVHTGELRSWDTVNGEECEADSRRSVAANCAAFTTNGKLVVTGIAWPKHASTLSLVDVTSRETLTSARVHRNEVTAVAISTDGEIAATASGDKTIRVWRLADFK